MALASAFSSWLAWTTICCKISGSGRLELRIARISRQPVRHLAAAFDLPRAFLDAAFEDFLVLFPPVISATVAITHGFVAAEIAEADLDRNSLPSAGSRQIQPRSHGALAWVLRRILAIDNMAATIPFRHQHFDGLANQFVAW